MFYVLNFTSHTFQTCNCEAEVKLAIETHINCGVQPDCIEVVSAFGDDIRYSAEQFLK